MSSVAFVPGCAWSKRCKISRRLRLRGLVPCALGSILARWLLAQLVVARCACGRGNFNYCSPAQGAGYAGDGGHQCQHRPLGRGLFPLAGKGGPPLPGRDQGHMAYDVLGESEARSRFDIVVKQRRLTPFVGREAELVVLRERWEQVQEGMGWRRYCSTANRALAQVPGGADAHRTDCWRTAYALRVPLFLIISTAPGIRSLTC